MRTTKTEPISPLAVSVTVCASMMSKSVRAVWQAVASGELSHIRDGRRVLIPVSGIEDYLLRRTVKPIEVSKLAANILADKSVQKSRASVSRVKGKV